MPPGGHGLLGRPGPGGATPPPWARALQYEVELVLDGRRFLATASWPADEIRGYEPSVALRFTPDLPAPA
jgi:hypothetical protein